MVYYLIFYTYIRSLAGALYITVVEVLAISINADRSIEGVQIGDPETKQ